MTTSAKEGESTIELQKEIHRMAELYRAGHILPKLPDYYSEEKWEDYCANLGVIFTRGYFTAPKLWVILT